MSEAFVSGAVPLRWEFDSILNTFAAAAMDSPPMRAVERAKRYAAARAEVCRAFDAQAARIAELESPAHRARIAREFFEEAQKGESTCASLYSSAQDTLERWEAAAKEGA